MLPRYTVLFEAGKVSFENVTAFLENDKSTIFFSPKVYIFSSFDGD